MTYTFDANGNLLDDGVNTYIYDSANRLKTMNSGQPSVSSYQYNGLGDRLSQTVNGVTTTYTLDLNTGLTQVLNDGTNAYIYGLGRIVQVNVTTEYFLGDALGSVRQLVNSSGNVTLAKSYAPYGETRSSVGSGTSIYSYTGEQQDSYIKLIYLRSRMYSPASGRFTTRDSWLGDYNRPLSLNRWNYVEGNPVNYTDPSGHCLVDSQGNILKTDCTVGDFEKLSWEEREQWVEAFVKENNLGSWHNDMQFAIKFMKEDSIHSKSTSAAFFMDAVVLQSMNDGMNMIEDRPCISHCDESQLWDDFYNAQRDGKSLDQALIDIRLNAEQGGVDVATNLAIQNCLYDPTSTDYDDIYFGVFLEGANGYRWAALYNNKNNPGGMKRLFDPRESGYALYVIGKLTNGPIASLLFSELHESQKYHIGY